MTVRVPATARMSPAELRALIERVLAMREPVCACGHPLTGHTRRQTVCYHRDGCRRWTPAGTSQPHADPAGEARRLVAENLRPTGDG